VNDSINRRSRYLALLLAILFATSTTFGVPQTAPTPARALSGTEQQLLDRLSVATIKETVNALAADDMQGRGTAQPGGDKAAAYLADRFAKLGLKPLGDKNSYLQPIKFRETQFLQTTFTAGNETLKSGEDFFVSPPYSGDENIKGDVVFVGYGLAAPFLKRNDFNGIDVRGKIVLLRSGPPPEINKDQWKKAHAQASVMGGLISRGAAAIVLVGQSTETLTFSEVGDYLTRRQVEPASEQEFPDFVPPFLSVSEAAADKLFTASGTTRAEAFAKAERDDFAAPIDLKQPATITIKLKKSTGISNNVVGLLEGSDPKLKSEALVYSAHYDAYGLSSDNRIYHGAADNALGVAEMLSIAEVLTRAESKPRRSIIFLAVTGEEYGGYGSDYWVKNPTWKIKQVAADLNLDGMGTEVYGPVKALVAYGAEHSTLGNLVNEVAAATGLRVIPDPMPEEKSFYRSDHYFFVKKGVPGIMILGAPDGTTESWTDRLRKWEKTDYHQPTDIVRPDWDWSGPGTVAGVMLLMGVRAADAESMPEWLPSSIFNRERGTDKPAPPEP